MCLVGYFSFFRWFIKIPFDYGIYESTWNGICEWVAWFGTGAPGMNIQYIIIMRLRCINDNDKTHILASSLVRSNPSYHSPVPKNLWLVDSSRVCLIIESDARNLDRTLPRLSWSTVWTAVADNMNNCLHSISGLVPPVALPLQLHEPFYRKHFSKEIEKERKHTKLNIKYKKNIIHNH